MRSSLLKDITTTTTASAITSKLMFIVMHDRDQKHVVMVDERSIVLQLCCHHGADIEVLSLA